MVRCIALAELIQKKFEVAFIFKDCPEQIIEKAVKLGFNMIHISDESEWVPLLKKDEIVFMVGPLWVKFTEMRGSMEVIS